MAARGDERDGPSDPLIGRTIAGRYLVRRAIGRGGMGAVYEALHVGLDRRVALKVILERHAGDREAVERFHREARTASRIGDQHIVQIVDVGRSDDGQSYIAMEYLDGCDLGQVLRAAGALDPARAIHIMEQVLLGLEAAHAEGIVHRDLKPENVFLTERDGASDFAVLMDFGISKVLAAEEERVRLTHTGVVVGTPLYMAPEQALGEPDLDHRVDLYAAGVMLYEMLAGRPPFEGPSYAALVAQHLTEPPPFLAGLRPGLPPGLVSAVHRALEKRRDRRFATASQLRDALLAAAADLPDPAAHDDRATSSMTAASAPPVTSAAPSDSPGPAAPRPDAAPSDAPGIAEPRPDAAPSDAPGIAAPRPDAAPSDAPGIAAPMQIEVPVFRPPPRRPPRTAARFALVGGGIAAALAVGLWRGATGENSESARPAASVERRPAAPTASADLAAASGAEPSAAGAEPSASGAAPSAAGAEPSAAGAAPTAAGAAPSGAAVLEIDSGPRGAHVFVDGVHRGRTPVRLDDVAIGDHRIRLELRGYQLIEADKAVRAGTTESFFAALARRGSGHPGSISSGGRVPGGSARPEPGSDPAAAPATDRSPDPPGPVGEAKSNPYLELRRRSP